MTSATHSNLQKSLQDLFWSSESLGFTLDMSAAGMSRTELESYVPQFNQALANMAKLEAGAIANADEKRMVGHYWLRHPELAPSPEMTDRIESTVSEIKAFVSDIHAGRISSPEGVRFDTVISIGIGGSALGPQLVERALGTPEQSMSLLFIDNTDPEGIDSLFAALGPEQLATTMVLVTSKSGGTPETLNGMLEAEHAFESAGFHFPGHAVAVTGMGSKLYKRADEDDWLSIFPMEDWVGGRTSVTSAVGLLPAALGGVDVDEFLRGAKEMDEQTRNSDPFNNPAALLAAAWHHIGGGHGKKDMVVLPYKDRLELFSRYLQQLVMESVGKALDRDGNRVEQGLAVYGNKGSTDQHAYVQQLRDGLRNFFVTFITVEEARPGRAFEVSEGVRTSDYLNAFFLGTRKALADEGRASLTLGLKRVSAFHLSALIALFERAVGLYAELINVNAYHQPGVEAGKKAATVSLELQAKILKYLSSNSVAQDYRAVAEGCKAKDSEDVVYYICRHLAATGRAKASGHGLATTFRGLSTQVNS